MDRVAWSGDVGKVFTYALSHNDLFLGGAVKVTLNDGELRIQHNLQGYLLKAKPGEHGVWKVKVWLSRFDRINMNNGGEDLLFAVMENMDNYLSFEAMGDYLDDSEEAFHNVYYALTDTARNAVDKRDVEEIHARVPGLKVSSFGGMLPFQAEGAWGEDEDIIWYFRYRHGYASLSFNWLAYGQTPEDKDYRLLINPNWSAVMNYGDDHDGSLTMKEFTDLFCLLVKELKCEPFAYKFKRLNKPVLAKRSFPATIRAWDAKSARIELDGKPYPYNFGNDIYAREPITEDYRIYPWPHPKFIVLDA